MTQLTKLMEKCPLVHTSWRNSIYCLVIKHLLNIRLAWNQESFPKLSLREGDMAEKKRSSAQILTSKQTGLYCKSAKYIIFSDYVTECRVVENQDDLTSWQVCRLVLVLILQCHCFTFLKSKHTASVCSFKWWQLDEQYLSAHNTQAYILQERSITCVQKGADLVVSNWIWTEGIQVMRQSNQTLWGSKRFGGRKMARCVMCH
jgi:hypothetical protein